MTPTRSIALLLLVSVALAAFLPTAGAAAPRPTVKITEIEVTTDGGGREQVKPGATIRSCSSDPRYGIGVIFTWAHVKVPGTETISTNAPGTAADSTVHSKLFDASGKNGTTVAAEAFGTANEVLPAGTYRFKFQFDGTAATAQVKVVDAEC